MDYNWNFIFGLCCGGSIIMTWIVSLLFIMGAGQNKMYYCKRHNLYWSIDLNDCPKCIEDGTINFEKEPVWAAEGTHACPLCGRDCNCDLHDFACWCTQCIHWEEVQE